MWPNPEVADAYLNPIVDHSTEKFVWGLPDLEGIREWVPK
jgi:DNA excision repair protein ERCC-5